MSYGIHPFAVSIDEIKGALAEANKPAGFLSRIFGGGGKDLIKEMKQRDPDVFDDEDDGFDDEDELSTEQALRDIIAGKMLNEHSGHTYGYALLALCWHFGEFQDNSQWTQMRAAWAETVDTAIRSAGVDKDTFGILRHVLYRGMPIDIPAPDDFPAVGYLLNAELADVAKALANGDYSGIEKEARESIAAIPPWLDRAKALKRDLVFFYF